MKSIWITGHGDVGNLEVRETSDPTPNENEVLIDIKAAGLNFAEIQARQGLYPDAPKPPCVVGYECSGVVKTVGANVTSIKEGMRVLALQRFGCHSNNVCVPENQVRQIPETMPFDVAAALPVNYLTAYHMLFHVAGLSKGQRVLVHMAAGGVGIAALQLCRTVENVTVYGTSSESKHEIIALHGCTHPIDYRTKDYVREIRRLTNREGVDIVLDALGGNDWRKGFKLLRSPGILVGFGFANLITGSKRNYFQLIKQMFSMPLFNMISLMNQNKGVSGVNMGQLWNRLDLLGAELDEILRLYNEGAINPVIDSTYSFDDVANAHERIQSRQNIGKVILVP